MSGHSQGGGSIPAFINNNHASNHIVGDGNTVINNNRNINFAFSSRAHTHPSMTIQNALGKHCVPDAAFKAQTDKGCMPGTRVKFLNDVFAILKTRSGPRIVWVAGMAGMGKTSIALTLCEQLDAEASVCLGGAFFCSRSAGSIERMDVQRIIPTLATALARQFPDYASSLAKLLEVEPEIAHFPVRRQVDVLLKQPLERLAPLGGQIVFVIDALDECSDPGKLADLLDALADFNGDQPVKFMFTSRPEMHIRQSPINDPVHSSILQLHMIDPALVTDDIRLYITATLKRHRSSVPWYTPGDVDALVQLSAGLFIFAATITRYILDQDTSEGFQERMCKVTLAATISHAATASVDSIYEFILKEASRPDKVDENELHATRRVLACILAARVPVSVESLSELLGINAGHLRERLNRLHSVVYLPPDNVTVGIRTLHASFGDYLFNRASLKLRIKDSLGDFNLAHGCLQVMVKRLCFNVSRSRSSHEPNAVDLPESISHALAYACLQWIHHIANLPRSSTFDEHIAKVFRPRFLFWLEVLSMLRLVRRATAMLIFAASTVQHPDLSRFLRDANIFVASSHDAIERSTPHIYLSALPFADKSSLVYHDFSYFCSGVVSVETFGINQHGGRLVMKLIGHEASVETVAYSPDGHLLASGSRDGSVRIWDMRTGEQMVSPMQTDGSTVHSVAFAPNGDYVASGSESGVVQIRGVVTGAGAPRSLRGHSAAVLSVAYSPDGTLIASASADLTIRLWDAVECVTIIVLKGHKQCIRSIAFSPDSQFLASGSDDRTARLWHAKTGESRVPALYMGDMGVSSVCFSPDGAKLASSSYDGSISLWAWRLGENIATVSSHSDSIRSISFSPDGRFIVSASANKAVWIWNVLDGHTDVPPVLLGSHLGAVNAVSYSSSGLYVASASEDSAIAVWHAGDSQLEREALQSHTSAVSSVAVSSDSTFIVSGSFDGSVRVWIMNTPKERLPPLLGHAGEVYSVAISSDGRLIASGSADRTIRLWAAQTGSLVGMPLRSEHKIEQVVFSRDTRLVASGSTDGTVSIWATTTSFPAPFSPLRCTIDPHKWGPTADSLHTLVIDFSPDLQYLVVGTSEGCVQLWHAVNGLPINPPLRAKMEDIVSQMPEPVLRGITADVSERDLYSALNKMTVLALHDVVEWAHWLNLLAFDPDCGTCVAQFDGLIQNKGMLIQVSHDQSFESRPRNILSHVSRSSRGALLARVPKQMLSNIVNQLPDQTLITAVEQALPVTVDRHGELDWTRRAAILGAVPESKLLIVFGNLPESSWGAMLAALTKQMLSTIFSQLPDQTLITAIEQVLKAAVDRRGEADWTTRAAVLEAVPESKLLIVLENLPGTSRGAMIAALPNQILSTIFNQLPDQKLITAVAQAIQATFDRNSEADWTRRAGVLGAVPDSKLLVVFENMNESTRIPLLVGLPQQMWSTIFNQLSDQNLITAINMVLQSTVDRYGGVDWTRRAAVLGAVPESKLLIVFEHLSQSSWGAMIAALPKQMLSNIFNQLPDQTLITAFQRVLLEKVDRRTAPVWTRQAAAFEALPESKLLIIFENLPEKNRGAMIAALPKQMLSTIFSQLPDQTLITTIEQMLKAAVDRRGEADWTKQVAVLGAVPESKLLIVFENLPVSARGSLLTRLPKQPLSIIFNQLSDQNIITAVEQVLKATIGRCGEADWTWQSGVLGAVPESKLLIVFENLPESSWGFMLAGLPKQMASNIFNQLPDQTLITAFQRVLLDDVDRRTAPVWTRQAAAFEALPESKFLIVLENLPGSTRVNLLTRLPRQTLLKIFNAIPHQQLVALIERNFTSTIIAAFDLLPDSTQRELVRRLPVSHLRGTIYSLPSSNIRAILSLLEPESIPPFSTKRITSIAFSPDSAKIVSGLVNGDLSIWDVHLRSRSISFRGHSCSVNAVAWSTNGQIIASGSDDSTFRLWNAENGQNINTLHGHTRGIRSITFTPDGRSIVSGSEDGTIRIWDVAVITSPDAPDPFRALSSARRDNGWLIGPSGELLMWIPQEYQANLVMGKSCTTLIASHRVVLSADENGLYSGEDWVNCWKEPAESHALGTEEQKCERDDQQDERLGWFAISVFCLVRFLLIVTAVGE